MTSTNPNDQITSTLQELSNQLREQREEMNRLRELFQTNTYLTSSAEDLGRSDAPIVSLPQQ